MVNYQELVWLLLVAGPSYGYLVSGQIKWWWRCFPPKFCLEKRTSCCGKSLQPPPGVSLDMSESLSVMLLLLLVRWRISEADRVCRYKAQSDVESSQKTVERRRSAETDFPVTPWMFQSFLCGFFSCLHVPNVFLSFYIGCTLEWNKISTKNVLRC